MNQATNLFLRANIENINFTTSRYVGHIFPATTLLHTDRHSISYYIYSSNIYICEKYNKVNYWYILYEK